MVYVNWADEQPNSDENEYCMLFATERWFSGRWMGRHCDSLNCFICEVDANPGENIIESL